MQLFQMRLRGCLKSQNNCPRDELAARKLWDSLPPVYRQCAVPYTDFWNAYRAVFLTKRHQAVGKVDATLLIFNQQDKQRRIVDKGFSRMYAMPLPTGGILAVREVTSFEQRKRRGSQAPDIRGHLGYFSGALAMFHSAVEVSSNALFFQRNLFLQGLCFS